jgi:hypothetical protein
MKLWEILKDIEKYEDKTFKINLPGEWHDHTVRVLSGHDFYSDSTYHYIKWIKKPEGVIDHELSVCGAAIEAEYILID